MAPILSFTAEDVWSFMPGADKPESVFLAGLPPPPAAWRADAIAARFERLLAVRAAVTKAIEEARQSGVVKQASEARVVLGTTGAEDGLGPMLHERNAELPALFLTAEVAVGDGAGTESPLVPGLRVMVERATGQKCPRCWTVRRIGADARHPDLCERCAGVLG
jgi:isoleucyl-tRNA synthetase